MKTDGPSAASGRNQMRRAPATKVQLRRVAKKNLRFLFSAVSAPSARSAAFIRAEIAEAAEGTERLCCYENNKMKDCTISELVVF
jgi:hypothetical protein